MLGLLYDVHGNLPALEAVLEDARGAGVGRFVVGGDVALFGAWPAETVARLRDLADASWLRGNGERWLVDGSDRPPALGEAARACADALGDDLVSELAALPGDVSAGDTLFVHASPLSDMRSFFPEPGDDEGELLESVPAAVRLLVFGHTHLAFQREARGREGLRLANPGSVGMPLDGDARAAFAVLGDDGSVEHRRVAYDHERSAAAIGERFAGADWTHMIAGRVRNARMEGA